MAYASWHEKNNVRAPAGVSQWIEGGPANWKCPWFSSLSGHMPGLWARFPVEGVWEVTERWPTDVSLPLFLPSFPYLWKQINKIFKKKKKKEH